MRFRWLKFNIEISKVTGPTFTGLVLPNAGKIVVKEITHRFLSIPEIFAEKLVFALTPQHRGESSAKVSSGYTPNSEVIGVYLLHFKPIFDPLLKKVVRRAFVSGGKCASKTWSL